MNDTQTKWINLAVKEIAILSIWRDTPFKPVDHMNLHAEVENGRGVTVQTLTTLSVCIFANI